MQIDQMEHWLIDQKISHGSQNSCEQVAKPT